MNFIFINMQFSYVLIHHPLPFFMPSILHLLVFPFLLIEGFFSFHCPTHNPQLLLSFLFPPIETSHPFLKVPLYLQDDIQMV